jgi:outer membrane protein OmpA-like peptidoglycan-associated protein
LSQARADAVKAALEERGVTNELIAVGFGEQRLKISPDDTAEAQQANRRIEFRIL